MLASETRLAGIDYRSRTEAEWASIMAAHNVRFEYESRLFRFSFVAPANWWYAVSYIPDFWLPDHKLWLEVKPHRPNLIEYRKAALLAECTGCGVLVTTGGPGIDELLYVKDARKIESVSTIGAAPMEQAPLKLDVDVLTNTRLFTKALRPLTEGIHDTILAGVDAIHESMGWPAEQKKRALFLPPGADPSAECFCDETQATYCPHCSGAMRVLLTEENWKRLQSIDGLVPMSAQPR